MVDTRDISENYAGIEADEMKIVVNSLYLSLVFLLDRLKQAAGEQAASAARHELIESLRFGNINMAIMEDTRLFDFVLSVAEALPDGTRPSAR